MPMWRGGKSRSTTRKSDGRRSAWSVRSPPPAALQFPRCYRPVPDLPPQPCTTTLWGIAIVLGFLRKNLAVLDMLAVAVTVRTVSREVPVRGDSMKGYRSAVNLPTIIVRSYRQLHFHSFTHSFRQRHYVYVRNHRYCIYCVALW